MPHFCPACCTESPEEIGAQSREYSRQRGEVDWNDTPALRRKDKAMVKSWWKKYYSQREQILGRD